MPDFYNLDGLSKVAVNLFNGWGYNFYRVENQLRADDLLVRAKIGWLLGRAQGSVTAAESAYRREFLPPPSRAKPRPDAEAVRARRRSSASARRSRRWKARYGRSLCRRMTG